MSNGNSNPKIIDLIKKKENGSKPFVSIEFFPPRTEQGVKVRLCLLCRVPTHLLSMMQCLGENMISTLTW